MQWTPPGRTKSGFCLRNGTQNLDCGGRQDSCFVAYVSQAAWFEGGLFVPDAETCVLRVRQLQDNSESRIAGPGGGESYEWVANEGLLINSRSTHATNPPCREEKGPNRFWSGALRVKTQATGGRDLV
jgi:hypothetical protein